jgi:CheY-like chemotaxis protein
MPIMDGLEVLNWIKQSAQFTTVPVIVLTGLGDDAQAKRAYALGAASFLTKPSSVGDSAELINTIQRFVAPSS